MLFQILKPLDRKLVRDLMRMWGQGLAIAMVVGAGVAMYVMSEGMLRSLADTRDAYYERYGFADVFATLKRAPNSTMRKIQSIPGVRQAEGRISKMATLDMPGLNEPAQERIISYPQNDHPAINRLHLVSGGWFSPGVSDEVLVAEAFAMAHDLKPKDVVTALINGKKRKLKIAGIVLSPEFVYALAPGAMFPDDERFAIMWMARQQLAGIFNMKGTFNEAVIKLEPGANEDEVIARIDAVLEPYGSTGALGRDRQISDWFLSGEMKQLANMGRIAPPIFFVVAIYLLNITISRWVELERSEIGLLKAFGYSTRAVANHYLKFVIAITLIGVFMGSIAGTWLGWGLAAMYEEFFHFPFLYFSLDMAVYVVAGMLSCTAALLGTIGAVRRAVKTSPAEAMVPQPPTLYRRGKSEHLIRGALGPTRMIIRHLLRWPLRSALTCMGISLGVAVLVSVMFFEDATDSMVETQFSLIEAQDATITFGEVKSSGVMENIKSMPGVLAAEPFRYVPVTIKFGSSERRMVLKGLPENAMLNRVLDKNLKPVPVAPEGITMSSKLGEMLGAGLGDVVSVKVHDGRRPTLQLPVTMISETYIASPAFMEISALNRALKEGKNTSGAHVMLDDALSNDFYSAIKETPSIAQVAVKEAMLKAFNDTMSENINIMNFFNTIFAVVIAVGVVYNAGRISLSERSRELASLRVLGFTRGEVSYILLGELGLLLLLALPIGSLFGYGLAWFWALSLDTDLYRVPLVISSATFGYSILVVVLAGIATAIGTHRQIINLNLIEALKTRE